MSSDTHPAVLRLLVEGYRSMPAWQKLARVNELSIAVRDLASVGVMQRNPGMSAAEARREVASLCLPADLLARVDRSCAGTHPR